MAIELYPEVPDGFTLREATEVDAEGIASVFSAAYPDGTTYPYANPKKAQNGLLNDDYFVTFAVEADNGDIAATASIRFNSVYTDNAEICKLAVKPDYQGNGLARALLQHRLGYLEDIGHSGPIFSAAVTEHPYSQQNLNSRGLMPVSFHKGLQTPFFGDQPESQAIVLHENSVSTEERPLYVPQRLRDAVEYAFGHFSDSYLNRDVRYIELDVDEPEPTIERDPELSGMGDWYHTAEGLEDALHSEGAHIMFAADMNSPDAKSLYEVAYKYGLTPVGVIPDWLHKDGENRDAVIFQYLKDDPDIDVEFINGMKVLLDHLGYEYQITAEHDDYWELIV
ncbi:GNAT family N-acetyltransferase [Salinarchaeum sp. IM2453]|uniref:GNAT family N-acetyltransferase n=1 Tax=Salinarchaeum sp. IM2453 TaxID=2862870 RepID=UPI001C83F749|nr:GNAT family N-acetyltransferase [Salinarchaeum sp. IM2453]QZA89217.1 GNAT family N-acetyltransferase [Salinarchaeum sp. IM2453]